MSLAAVLDTAADRLRGALGGTSVGEATPVAPADLPVVVVSLDEARSRLPGVGRSAAGTRVGALRATVDVDLAAPVLDLGGERLDVLSPDRRTVTLPHGPVVRADGVGDLPFAAGDLDVAGAVPFTLVATPPGPGEVAVDPARGTLLFGTALPASGTLRIGYHIGRWDVVAGRFTGRLLLDVHAADVAGVRDLGRRAAAALTRPGGGLSCTPTSWGAITPADPDAGPAGARTQRLGFGFDAELEEPVLTSGGGVISTVEVVVRSGGVDLESFAVDRAGSPR